MPVFSLHSRFNLSCCEINASETLNDYCINACCDVTLNIVNSLNIYMFINKHWIINSDIKPIETVESIELTLISYFLCLANIKSSFDSEINQLK